MQKYIIFFLIGVALLVSCNNRHVDTLELKKTIAISDILVNSDPNVSYVSQPNPTVYIYAANDFFYKYDLSTSKIIDSVKMSDIPDKRRFDFCMLNNSIYLFKLDKNLIEKYNANAMFEQKYFYNNDSVYIYPLFSDFKIVHDRTFMYSVGLLNVCKAEQRLQYFSNPIFVELKMQDSSLVRVRSYGKFPKEYLSNDYMEYYPFSTNVDSVTNAYIFSTAPKLYIDHNGVTTTHEIDGLPKNNIFPASADSLNKFDYQANYTLGSENYSKLLYNEKHKNYFLFQIHPLVADTTSDEIALYRDKTFTVYVIDSNYNVVARKDFGKIGPYLISKSVVMNDVLYLPKLEPNKHLLNYECYEIKAN